MLATPLLPGDYLDLVRPLGAGGRLHGRVLEVLPETPGAASLVIRPGRDWRRHRPGQYVRLGVEIDGVRHWRAYSLTSAPDRADGCLTVTVKAADDGLVSRHLVHRARPGELLLLEQAAGDFTLPARPPAKALLLAAGSGITPLAGLLRSSLHRLPDVVLIHTARTPQEAIFGAELRALHHQGRLRLIERHTATEGRLTPAEVTALVPDHAQRDVWACGPGPLLDALEEHRAAHGLGAAWHTERFRLAPAAVGEGGTVTFTRSNTRATTDGATPLLTAGEDAGVLMPYGCRMGVCFGCVAPLTQGAVRDLRDGRLTSAVPGERVPVQTCVSAAAGPCEIEL
ncbi:ferredoxin reductase [Streptomyces polyrhachis]|uniref:Ferredoxin reductase n=1 Tax=Streptomyces polyrhachis TaxID=1282885 RepID=A0ABW2GIM4_9ACTN